MPRMNFTVRGLEALPTPESGRVEYWDKSVNGSFGLRVSASGQRTWVTMYRFAGRLRRFTIGNYERLPLADAREQARDILYRASKGEDPAFEKSKSRKAEFFSELADVYMEGWAKREKRSWRQDELLLKSYVLPQWKNRKACELKRGDVKALLRTHVERGAPIVANRVLSLVRKIFNYALEEEIGELEFNPCQAIKPPTDEKARQGQRVLTFEEIRKFWTSVEKSRHKEAGAIMKLRLISAQRGLELRLMEWSELDFESGWWTIPGSRTKNKLSHRVPITDLFRSTIEPFGYNRFRSKYVFASPIDSAKAILNLKDPFSEIFQESGIEQKFVMRDLRRTATSTMTGHLGIPRFTVGKILNHVEPGVTKVYDRHSYDREKFDASVAWCKLLCSIRAGSVDESMHEARANLKVLVSS